MLAVTGDRMLVGASLALWSFLIQVFAQVSNLPSIHYDVLTLRVFLKFIIKTMKLFTIDYILIVVGNGE